jgi:hypothetical protein
MSSVLFLDESPKSTLGELRDLVHVDTVQTVTRPHDIVVDLTGAKTVRFPRVGGADVEVPLNSTGEAHLANLLDIPSKFIERQDAALRQVIFQEMIARQPATAEMRVKYAPDAGLGQFIGLNAVAIEPHQLVHVAQQVLPAHSPITKFNISGDLFEFEVVAPEDHPAGRLGDPTITTEYQKGDLTSAGLRFGVDMKHNLAPTVTPFQYRLVCTNGMQMSEDGLKVDARGMSVEQVLHELERQAQQAFAAVEHQVEAFYRMREERVDNPERTLARLAGENGISDRTRLRLVERAAAIDNPTMFDLVNLVTNAANEPGVSPRLRSQLQRVGGTVVTQHHARCGHCQSRLN